jgi:tetratricopeptide (TPR) repeat protein
LGNYDISAQYFQQADSIANKTGNEDLFIYVSIQQARGKDTHGRQQEGLADLLKTETLAKTSGNKKLLSYSQRSIATTYQNSFSNFPKSMEYLLKVNYCRRRSRLCNCLESSYSGLAALYNFTGDQANSLLYYQKAAELNKKVGNKRTEAPLIIILANVQVDGQIS